MRGKDIKKAISYHMKRNQVLLDPRQKVACVAWFQVPPGMPTAFLSTKEVMSFLLGSPSV